MATTPTPPFKVTSIFEYKSDYDDDLSFPVGVEITVIEIEDDEWYSGSYGGKTGMFPKNFVTLIESSETKEADHVAESPATPKVEPVKTLDPEENLKSLEESPNEPVNDSFKESPSKSPVVSTSSSSTANPISSPSKATVNQALPRVPTGGGLFPNQKIHDPYSVKKQFVAAPKSSYVPQINPRDDSKVIHNFHNDSKSHPPPVNSIVNESTAVEEEPATPQLSLKERIALIQKQQQEEAEREAAAIKKQQERKLREKEKAEEKKKLAEEKKLHAEEHKEGIEPSDILDSYAVEEQPEGHAHEHVLRLDEGHVELAELEGATIEPTLANLKKSIGESEAAEQVHVHGVEEEEEAEEEEEVGEEAGDEEGSDDEELRRKKLVERMAKISGGRNMFGMMGGMLPFGQAPPPKKEVPKREKPIETQVSSGPTSPVAPIVQIPVVPTDPRDSRAAETSSMGEEDDFTESDTKFVDAGAVPVLPEVDRSTALKSSTDSLNEEDLTSEEASVTDITPPSSKITDQVDIDGTGYDADEDLSDKPKSDAPVRRESTRSVHSKISATDIEGSNISSAVPPIPSGRPPVPAPAPLDSPTVPSVPPPATPSTAPPVAAPPVPTSAPPIPTGRPPVQESTPSVPPPMPPIPTGRPPVSIQHTETEVVTPPIPRELPIASSTPGGPPPVPSTAPPSTLPPPPPPPVSEPTSDEHLYDDANASFIAEDSVSDFQQPIRASTTPGLLPPSIPEHAPPPPSDLPPPMTSPQRAATSDVGLSRNTTGSSITSLRRSSTDAGATPLRRTSTDLSRSGEAQLQARQSLLSLDPEMLHSTNWWLKGDLPESLTGKIGTDLVYEVETNTIKKRGGRSVIYRDYYILFHDLSQIVFEIEYDSEDPQSTVKWEYLAKPAPTVRKDLLDKYYREYGSKIFATASTLQRVSSPSDGIVVSILNSLKGALLAVGNKSFGVTVYRNTNNHNVARIDDIRPGDILCIKLGQFIHKGGPFGSNKTVHVGEDDHIYSAIISEFDLKKEKFRVIALDSNGNVHRESYKLADMKSGRLRVFRVVGRGYIGW